GTVAGVVAVAPAVSVDELPGTRAVPVPVHLVVGADDDLLDDVRALAGHLPGCLLDVVEGAGHEVPAEAVRRVLDRWTDTTAAGPERAAAARP
ncbi:alpha/beta fold hydrolase, partial [Streptomyces sp. UH6]|uniref:alpha/beta fold hydrolase n=1 Tax=Streptomyces sp. UH6 TaxID=2748379 RepID=UPI00182BFB9D|nr:hypothetical protein [Streptomyces sp. UH6]